MHRIWNEHYILADILRRADCAPHLAWVARPWRAALSVSRPLSTKEPTTLSRYTRAAAANGYVRLLQWYVEHGYHDHKYWLVWAVFGNQMETVEWLLAHMATPSAGILREAVRTAARRGRRALLLRLGSLSVKKNVDASTILVANGYVPLARELIECGWPVDSSALDRAAEVGDFCFIEWLMASGIKPSPRMVALAAKHGHVEVLRWCLTNGLYGYTEAAHCAASAGHLHVLQLLEGRIIVDEQIEVCAASGGHVPILEWLETRVRYREWHALSGAVSTQKRNAIDWLLAHGHPRGTDTMRWALRTTYDGDFVRWMLSRGFDPCPIGDNFVKLRLDDVKDMHSLGFSLDPAVYKYFAPQSRQFCSTHVQACQWLFDQGVAPPASMLHWAAHWHCIDAAEWAVQHGSARTADQVIAFVVYGEPDDVAWMLNHGWPSDSVSLATYRAAYEMHSEEYSTPGRDVSTSTSDDDDDDDDREHDGDNTANDEREIATAGMLQMLERYERIH